MSSAEVSKAQALSKKISQAGELAVALKLYVSEEINRRAAILVEQVKKLEKKQSPKGKTNLSPAVISMNETTGNNSYPARPVKQAGVVSCNTNCMNGNCFRTFDDGRKVHFRARQKVNPFTGEFEWNSGPC
jgi:hypothetical protein